jgi:hypothetical protein
MLFVPHCATGLAPTALVLETERCGSDGAPDNGDVSHEGSTVTMLRTFAPEKSSRGLGAEDTRGHGLGASIQPGHQQRER